MKGLNNFSLSSRMALSIKVAALIMATTAVYYQDFIILGNEALRSELMSHMLAVPFIFVYLVYRKRKILRAVMPFETTASEKRLVPFYEIVGVMFCLLAFLLYWHGSYTFYPLEFHIVSLPLFLAGAILLLFNVQTLRALAFPITFLLLLTPPPVGIVYTTSTFLSSIAAEATYTILVVIGLPVELTNQYGAPALVLQRPRSSSIPFVIGVASSGIYSLIGFAVFAFFAAYIIRGKIWQKTIVLVAGFPFIYSLNIFRIIFILLLGYQYGIEAPTEAFHFFGGWVLIFLGTFILMSASSKIFKIGIFREKLQLLQCNHNQGLEETQNYCWVCGSLLKYMNVRFSKRDLFKIVTFLICVALIVTIEVPVFALTEGPAQLILFSPSGEQASTEILPEISGYTLYFIYRDKSFEETAGLDAALVYQYNPKNGSGTPISATIEMDNTRSALHGPEVSLITWPETHGGSPKVTQLDLRDTRLLQNPPIIGRFFACQKGKSENVQVFLYWYVNALFKTGPSSEKKYAKISLIDFANSSKEITEVEEKLLPIGQAIASYWQPVKAWSWIALLIAQHGYIVIMIIMALLTVILVVQTVDLQEEKQFNLKMFNKLSIPEEKVMLQAVHQAQKGSQPTARAIAYSYQSLTGTSIETDKLVEKLKDAEEAGLVKRDIISEQDEPLLVWKCQIAFPNPKLHLRSVRKFIRQE